MTSLSPYVISGAGSLPNDRIKCCRICQRNGFPHEPIVWRETSLPTGQIEAIAFDYFKPTTRHIHKKVK